MNIMYYSSPSVRRTLKSRTARNRTGVKLVFSRFACETGKRDIIIRAPVICILWRRPNWFEYVSRQTPSYKILYTFPRSAPASPEGNPRRTYSLSSCWWRMRLIDGCKQCKVNQITIIILCTTRVWEQNNESSSRLPTLVCYTSIVFINYYILKIIMYRNIVVTNAFRNRIKPYRRA